MCGMCVAPAIFKNHGTPASKNKRKQNNKTCIITKQPFYVGEKKILLHWNICVFLFFVTEINNQTAKIEKKCHNLLLLLLMVVVVCICLHFLYVGEFKQLERNNINKPTRIRKIRKRKLIQNNSMCYFLENFCLENKCCSTTHVVNFNKAVYSFQSMMTYIEV